MPVFKDLFGCITIFPTDNNPDIFWIGFLFCIFFIRKIRSFYRRNGCKLNVFRFDIFLYLFPICRYCSARRILLFLPARIRYVTMDVMIDATITSANMIKTRNDVCIDKTSLKYMNFKTILSDLDAMMQTDFT